MASSPPPSRRARRRVAVVTGASRGLGACIARVLVDRGFGLVIAAREAVSLHAAASALTSDPARLIEVPGDVADPAVRASFVDAAAALGGLDILVNNASELGGIGPLAAVDLDRLERVLRVNVIAPLALSTLAAP